MITFPGAKINIGLRVIARRNDGFHDIEAVFYPVGLRDALELVADPCSKDSELSWHFRAYGSAQEMRITTALRQNMPSALKNW